MLRFISSVVAVVILVACVETVAPTLASNVYRVVSLDGKALPTNVSVFLRAGCGAGVLHRSEFAFGSDSMLEQRFWFTSDPSEQPAVYRTSFVQHGHRIWLSDGAGTGTVDGGSLRLNMPPTQICGSTSWDAVLR